MNWRPELVRWRGNSRIKPHWLPLAQDVTWQLLHERDPIVNISHAQMPTREAHNAFVENYPYRVWYLVCRVRAGVMVRAAEIGDSAIAVGTAYLTCRNEIGVFILKEHQGQGYGEWAVRDLMSKWSGRLRISKAQAHVGQEFYANINPENERSIAFFEKMGFGVRQLTLARKGDESMRVHKARRPAGPKPEEGDGIE